jgi:hypothetical protein
MGGPRLKGERLANLSVVLEHPETAGTSITVSSWYGGAQRTVEIVVETAICCSTGLPTVPIRWVLIRDPEGISGAKPCCAPSSAAIRLG